jgi:hypothetical protein
MPSYDQLPTPWAVYWWSAVRAAGMRDRLANDAAAVAGDPRLCVHPALPPKRWPMPELGAVGITTVQAAVTDLFAEFHRTGSTPGSVTRVAQTRRLFPQRASGGARRATVRDCAVALGGAPPDATERAAAA